MTADLLSLLWLLPIGFGVGAYGTLVGAGGGFILMPILILLYPDQSPALLSGISLAVVCLNALSGSVAYAVQRRIDYRSALLFALAATPGAVLGALTSTFVPRRLFELVFGVVLAAAAVFLFAAPATRGKRGATGPADRGVHRVLTDRSGAVWRWSFRPLPGVLVSFGVGFLSSLLGIGGGIIHVPLLTLALHFPIHVATATSHLVLFLTALGGTVTHVFTGVFTQGLRRVGALGLGVILGAQLGAYLSPRIRGRWILRGLALALLVLAIRISIGGATTGP